MLALPRTALMLAALLSAAALGACGASEGNSTEDKNTYVGQVNATVTKFAMTVTTVSESITTDSSSRQDRRTIKRFQAAINDVVGTLETIKVPGDVSKEHGMLVAAMTGFGNEIAAAGKAMRTHSIGALAEGQRQLGAATVTVNRKIQTATDAINTRLRAK